VSYPIIHIPTESSSNEIKGLVFVFIPLQLTLGRMVECIGDHVRFLDDLPNGATLAQEIVAGSVLPITKIHNIKNDKLRSTFLYVAFGSQSLLKPTSDQTGSDTN
jgi:L-rhamnose isomerase